MTNDYKFTARILNKNIECRAFTLREYKDLLKAKLDGRMEDEILKLFNKCTNAERLTKQEGELLLVNLWAQSMGEVNMERTWQCSCGKEIQVPINLTHASIDSNDELLYSFPGFKIKFKYPGLFEDKNTAQMVAECIDYIITETDEQIKVEDLTDHELEDLYSVITTEDITNIAEMLVKPQLQLAIPISCECGENHVHVIKGLKEFFKML